MPYVIITILLAALIMLAFQYWYITISAIAVILLAMYLPGYIRKIRRDTYFASEEFQAQKTAIASVIQEHNDVAQYAADLRSTGKFQLGASDTGSDSDLATFTNTSRHNYRRDRNTVDYSSNVHNCSLQVVRNAKQKPLEYLMKYFNIKPTPERLEEVENLGEALSRLEGAVANLKTREAEVTSSINPPAFILKYFRNDFYDQVGFDLEDIHIPYQTYRFEYVSAGGNSSQIATITLNGKTIDALIEKISTKIKFLQSAAGQRALMTQKLRNTIKQRDDYTCQICGLSTYDEPNLLLEIDHIVPVSRGGLSTEKNLQTLCWRCNRSKSNKILEAGE
ncbi:HNH endonuclease signature motif containing protein [Trueperella pyogenes]|uniref:HNH endonuclease n=1 Tax=Trueperella pyogenes TaxID=1661 RepID=UPI00345DC6B6